MDEVLEHVGLTRLDIEGGQATKKTPTRSGTKNEKSTGTVKSKHN
jgi:hypothetical protein